MLNIIRKIYKYLVVNEIVDCACNHCPAEYKNGGCCIKNCIKASKKFEGFLRELK